MKGKNMMQKLVTEDDNFAPSNKRSNELKRILKIFLKRKISLFGLIVVLLLIIAAIFAPILAPYDPDLMNLDNKLAQPSGEHFLGTDNLGRDNLSRIIFATRTSLIIGLGAVGIAAVIGETLGLIAGYFGGILYAIIMRFADTLMSLPMLILAMILATVLGGGILNVIIALSVALTAGHIRLMCAQTLSIKQNDYVIAASSLGAKNIRIMFLHILPNAFPPLLVMVTVQLGMTILAEAGLSFLGIGIVPPTPAWGSMINDGYKYLFTNPTLSFAPGVAIGLVVFGFNMMGDGLRDALDPKLRGLL